MQHENYQVRVLDEIQPEFQQAVHSLRAFFGLMHKAHKRISLYRHRYGKFHEYVREPYGLLSSLLDTIGVISLNIEQSSFRYQKITVYSDLDAGDSLAFRLYRDGVRLLVFKPGLGLDELTRFAVSCLENQQTSQVDEDLASLLWKQQFDFIEHVVMETFSLGTESTEQTQLEVDQIVNCLYQGLATNSKDTLSFARLSLDDLDIELEGVSVVAGLQVADNIIAHEEKQKFVNQVERDSTQGNLARLGNVLMKMFDLDLDDKTINILDQAFHQLVDGLILQEDFGLLFSLVDGLENLSQASLANQVIAKDIASRLLSKLSSQECINQVGQILETNKKPEVMHQIAQYFSRLDEKAVVPLLNILEKLTRIEARLLVRDFLIAFGPTHIQAYASHLQSPKANFIRDLLAVIQGLELPSHVKYIAPLIHHPSVAIRAEALSVIGDGSDRSGVTYILKALSDHEPQVRIVAACLLPNFDRLVANKALIALCQEPDFDHRSTEEQVAVYTSLAMLAIPETFAFFRKRLYEGGLVQRKHILVRKRNMVVGLAMSGSIATYRFVKEELESQAMDKEIASLFRWAFQYLSEQLLGEAHP